MNRKQRRATRKGQGGAPAPTPGVSLQVVFNEAVRHHQSGNAAEAQRLCRQVLLANPRHASSLDLLGVIASHAGHYADAVALIDQALSSKDTEPAYHCHLGIALRGQGKLEEAVAAFQRALALQPRYLDALNNLAVTLHQAGQLELAVSIYNRILEIKADAVEAHHNRANALQQQGKLGEAVTGYQRALALKSDYAEAHNNLGVAYSAQGLPDKALACYERAVAIKPSYGEAHFNRGNTLLGLGQLQEALASYRAVLDIVPNHAFTHHNMGVAMMPLDLDMAEASLRRALELSPNHPTILTSLASTMNAKGDPLKGLQLVAQSLQINEAEDAKRTFVACIGGAQLTSGDSALRALLTRALEESWGSPEELAAPAIALIKGNPATSGLIGVVSALEDISDPAWLSALGSDPLVPALLRSTPINDTVLERFLTMARRTVLAKAQRMTDFEIKEPALRFVAALASQCFINEYVFWCTDEEKNQASRLRDVLAAALVAGTRVPSSLVLTVACYFPLAEIAHTDRLLQDSWPGDVETTLTQQVREPREEQRIRATIPRLTNIDDEMSVRVRSQYEENPYPRWIKAARVAIAKDVEGFFRTTFPLAPIRPFAKPGRIEILIAGCGTGRQPIVSACRFKGAEVLAVDLSLTSLAYAKRKTQELALDSITYAQADLMKLGSLGRRFDIIEAAGVLHHLTDPWAGWRVLLSMLRPGGFMKVGLYSEVARRHIVELRNAIEQQGYRATRDDIRRCRRDLVNAPGNANLIRLLTSDFFSVSSCRDLLFHVQEHRLTLVEIETFLRECGLVFLGFDNVHPTILRAYKARFPDDPAAIHLGQWQAFEKDNPETFLAMYQFSVQKGP